MPPYVVSIEDLQEMQAQLTHQLTQLGTAQLGVEADVRDLIEAMTAGIAGAQARIDHQMGELAGTLTRSRSLAQAARWTGPDSEQFRAGTEQLLATIEQSRDQLLSGVEAHRAGAAALRADVDAASTAFDDAARTLAAATARLERAVWIEAKSYEEAFNGRFAYTDGAAPVLPPEGLPTGVPGVTIGPPYRPPFKNDDFWVYGSRAAAPADVTALFAWWGALHVAEQTPGFDDGAQFYRHYLERSGEPLEYDLQEAVDDDPAIRENVNADLNRTAAAVDQIAQRKSEFSLNTVTDTTRPATQNWNFAIGAYQQSSTTAVKVEGGIVTMTTTVHADDRYNFHAGASEGFVAPINTENGHLEEAGLARSFDSHGSLTRTYSWKLGDPPPTIDVGG
jgi:hypothetical protein